MTRLFQRHQKRSVKSLDGLWRFKIDPKREGFEKNWFQEFPEDSCQIPVPSCWNNELGYFDYEGLAWYATTFTSTQKHLNLVFSGVTGLACVYLDGKRLGSHYGGFTNFNFLVKDVSAGEHLLVVAVDNTHDDLNTIPLSRVDWFHYGGITRSVVVMELADTWIRDHKIHYELDQKLENASLSLDLTLEGLTEQTYQRQLRIYVEDEEVYTGTVQVNGATSLQIQRIKLSGIKLWDVGEGNLYRVRIVIDDDDITERIGFRGIEISERKFLLNGRELTIKGINRHEEHPDWGFAVPFKLMKRDVDIIKNLGCNAIRGSHYPNAEIFLDYCDQEGILFWEEIPMWGFPEEPLKNPLIRQRGLQMHEEMVRRDYHHPCIIIWGLHNEIDTRTEAGFEITKAFSELIRSLDQTRPITYATMYPFEDRCYSLVDIVSVNHYSGWYGEELENWKSVLKQLKEKLDAEGNSHLPIIISEFGAGAVYGERSFEAPKWTENYQEKYLEYTLKLLLEDSEICGTYIWQYCDIRSSAEMELSRPRSFNNKGLVNEYRQPKQAYWRVKEIYEQF